MKNKQVNRVVFLEKERQQKARDTGDTVAYVDSARLVGSGEKSFYKIFLLTFLKYS